MFNQWPYTNLHDLNLDWILKTVKESSDKIDNFNVQTEVDKKLDEMLADGSLASSVAEAISALDSFIPNAKYPPQGFAACKGDGVTDDTAAIQALIDAYGSIAFPSGAYVITSTIVCKQVHMIGASKANTRLVKTTHGPILDTGDRSTISDIAFTFSDSIIPTTNDSAIVMSGTVYPYQRGSIRDVIINRVFDGIVGVSGSAPFSCLFDTIEIGNYFNTGINIQGSADTQNVFSNIYINQGDATFQETYPARHGIYIKGVYLSNTFINCNVEHSNIDSAIRLENCINFTFIGCHIEGVKLRGEYGNIVELVNSSARFFGFNAIFCRIDKPGAAVFGMDGNYAAIYGNGTISKTLEIDGLFLASLNSPNTDLYPDDTPGPLPTDFKIVYRGNADTGAVKLYVRNYEYSTVQNDESVYNAFPYTNWKIDLCQYGDIPIANSGAPVQSCELKNGQTYFDTSENVMKVYNNGEWNSI